MHWPFAFLMGNLWPGLRAGKSGGKSGEVAAGFTYVAKPWFWLIEKRQWSGKSRGKRGESIVSETIIVKHCYVSICRVNKIMLSKYNNGKQYRKNNWEKCERRGPEARVYEGMAFPHCHPIIVGLNLVKLACHKENFSVKVWK